MKIQCSCGAKHEFDITPDMTSRPVRFVCPACGLDASECVDGLVRQELGQTATPSGAPVAIDLPKPATPAPPSAPAAAPAPARPVLAARVHAPETSAAEDTSPPARCVKHGGELAVEKCYVCAKPICPKCMELFGYVCSPLCKAKAESHGIALPVFAGQKSVVEARQWRMVVRISGAVGAVLVLLLGFWFWYAWFGSTPKVAFSVRFPERADSGQSAVGGKEKDQLIFLHGPKLARYDLKTGKAVWSRDVIDRKTLQAAVQKQVEFTKALIDKANYEGWEDVPKMPDQEKLSRNLERALAEELRLRVAGQNIWLESPNKLVRYEWDTGNPANEVSVEAGYGGLISRGDELLAVNTKSGQTVITRINLGTCESRTEELGGPALPAGDTNGLLASAAKPGATAAAGLPRVPGKDAGKPMDPRKVAGQVGHMSFPEKIALPATIAGGLNQERALAQLDDPGRDQEDDEAGPIRSNVSLIPTPDGFVEFSIHLLEARIVARNAMKAPPAKSKLDSGNVTAANSLEVAGELLNEWQRERGGAMVQEDESRYRVTVRRPGTASVWTAEVVGPPKLYPLQRVNVLAANKLIIVLDKNNKKLWQNALSFNVDGDLRSLDPATASFGQGPCVEHKDGLYVFDQGVLTAFDLATGNARWRLPSVGIAGVFFDDQDMLYVNTSTASPESLKYSRQIDLSSKVVSVVLKVDSRTGKILWSVQPGGLANYVSGKFIYVVQSYMPEEEEDNPYRPETGFEAQPYLRIRRLSPNNGRELWEHFQQRCPLDIAFDQNTIRLVFRKEVQVLRFMSF